MTSPPRAVFALVRVVQEVFRRLPHERDRFSFLPPREPEVSPHPSEGLSISLHPPSFPCLVPGAEQELLEPVLSWRMGENLKLSSEF